MKYVAPSAPLSVGGVLDDWIRLFRCSFGACWALALIGAIAGALVQFTTTPSLPKPGVSSFEHYLQYFSALRAPPNFLISIAFWLILFVVYGALLVQQAAIVRGEEAFSFQIALAKGLRRMPQMLLGWLLLVLIVVAISIPGGIGAAIFIPFRGTPLAVPLAALGLIALLIVLIYVMVRLQLWLAAMFVENRGGASSLGRSWDLVKGHWWRVTGISFVSGILIWILSMAFGAVIGAAIGFMGVDRASPDALVRQMQLIGAIGALARVLTVPLSTAVWLAIYHDLILRREGGDLEARAEALGGT